MSKNHQIVFGLVFGFIMIWIFSFFIGDSSSDNEINVEKQKKFYH